MDITAFMRALTLQVLVDHGEGQMTVGELVDSLQPAQVPPPTIMFGVERCETWDVGHNPEKIQAIRVFRQLTDKGLKECKELIDSLDVRQAIRFMCPATEFAAFERYGRQPNGFRFFRGDNVPF